MADRPTFTTAQIAKMVGGELNGPGDLTITGINSMSDAAPDQVTFISSPKYARRWADARAGAALVTRGVEVPSHDPAKRALIIVENAELATAPVLSAFVPPVQLPDVGVHPMAYVHPEANVSPGARIGPLASVGRAAVIGEGAVLMPGAHVYPDAVVGENTIIHSGTVIRERCRVGARVILHQNVSIGADGFGFRPRPDGAGLEKMPHVGIVVIEDDVEIGAGSCVDRAKFGETVIGRGTKLDNMVQVAHNCRIGRACVIAAHAGLAGSVTIGDGVQVGAQVGIADGVAVGDNVRIGAKSGLMRDVAPGRTILGVPAEDAPETLRQWAGIRKLPELLRKTGMREGTKARRHEGTE